MKYTWEFEERDTWRFDEFDTIEECIEDCKNYCTEYRIGIPPMSIPKTIVIGETNKYAPYVNAESLLEDMIEQAYDCVGEIAEDWCIDYTEITQLESTINTVVHKWLKETDNLPNFYWVKNIREIEIT